MKSNAWIQTLHGSLILLQMGIAIVKDCILDSVFMPAIINIVDFFVQLIICYICYVQGSDSALNRHECLILRDRFGNLRLRFRLKSQFE